jgi:ethanolaminephosphotransferase
MDGKQARRTNTSSPLGLAVDHGVDAFNINLSAINVMAMMQAGDSPTQCLIMWLISAVPFFFATWEEYYTGVLHLGAFNGPTDGVLIMCATFVLSGVLEDYAAFWNAEFAWGISRQVAVTAFYTLSVFGTVVLNVASVISCFHKQHPKSLGTVVSKMLSAFLTAMPFCLIGCAGAVLLATSKSDVFNRHPRLLMWSCGCIFQKLVKSLQLAHVCSQVYTPWKEPMLLVLVVWVANYIAGAPLDEAVMMWVSVAVTACSLAVMVWQAVNEMAAALGVRVFHIPAPADKTKTS